MNIAIRADASEQLGSGHVMRCLTLADDLRDKGANVLFVCAKLPGNMAEVIVRRGYKVCLLSYLNQDQKLEGKDHVEVIQGHWQQDAYESCKVIQEKPGVLANQLDWVIVDHYGLDYKWHKEIRKCTKKIMVIDDLANRKYDCDLLLDQNLEDESRYAGLVPANCKLLLGPKYALLRPEFRKASKNAPVRDGQVKRVMVFFGGADHTNETSKALEAIELLDRPDITFDVVVGAPNPHKDEVKSICEKMPNVKYHCQVDNMAEIMVKADLFLGAGGSTTWERCSVGLPAITIAVAMNQLNESIVKNLEGIQVYLGKSAQISSDDILLALIKLLDDQERLLQMADTACNLMNCCDYHVVIENILNL